MYHSEVKGSNKPETADGGVVLHASVPQQDVFLWVVFGRTIQRSLRKRYDITLTEQQPSVYAISFRYTMLTANGHT